MGVRHRILAFGSAGLVALFILAPFVRAQEPDVVELLARADEFSQNGNYKLAIGTYLEAAGMSKRPMNLSRAYFGLALCHFFEGDSAAATKWILKVAEVDPNKQISELFYPKPFVDLFDQVMKEGRGKETPPSTPPPVSARRVPEKPPAAAGEEPKRPAPSNIKPDAEIPKLDFSAEDERPGGHVEIGVHVATWTVDPIMSLFESKLVDELAEELQNEVVKKVGASYSGLVKAVFSPKLDLDSEGSNAGLEVRYYAFGRAGTFSLGLGLERTRIRLGLVGSLSQDFTNGSKAEVTAEAFVETAPLCPHLSFRWEIGRPEALIKPFLTFGLGIAPLKGTFTYSYSGTYAFGALTDTIEDAKTKTFVELSEDIDFHIPDYIAVLQLGFGLKLNLFKGVFVLGEAGVWDGLLLRGGLGYRF